MKQDNIDQPIIYSSDELIRASKWKVHPTNDENEDSSGMRYPDGERDISFDAKVMQQELMISIGERIGEKCLRMGDEIVIKPAIGRTKVLTINRTKYIFRVSKKYQQVEIFENIYINLPSVDGQELEFEMRWIPTKEDLGLFLFKAKNLGPFKLNQFYVSESYLEVGQLLTLGHNQVEFKWKLNNSDVTGNQEFLLDEKESESNFILQSFYNEKLLDKNLAKSDLSILLIGETGTGKSTLAKHYHEMGQRRGKFVQLNLASFSEGILESELFGHIKGAFTGAMAEKIGALEEADGGTLFLDEIDSVSKSIQTKLLLFLDSMEIRPVGSNLCKKVNTRIIFASGKNLLEEVKEKRMRKDFYFRISSSSIIHLPQLVENGVKIEELVNYYSRRRNILIDPKLLSIYKSLKWPGNYRQLLGHLKKKVVLTANSNYISYCGEDEKLIAGNEKFDAFKIEKAQSRDILGKGHFDESWPTLESCKILYAKKAFEHFDRSIQHTCDVLKITPKTLIKFLNRLELAN